MQTPDVSYARSGDVAIAYQTVGEGPVDVVFARGFAGTSCRCGSNRCSRGFVDDLAAFARVTLVDKRGTGLSDGVGERAIGCARTLVADVHALGLELRVGLHTGECERHDGKLTGIAVPVAGSGLEFEDRGVHELKGVPGEWRLFAVRA